MIKKVNNIELIIKKNSQVSNQILNNFIEICSEKRGELKTEIKSAKNLSKDEINKIKDKNFGVSWKKFRSNRSFKIINKKRLNIKNDRKDTFSCSLKSISI